MGLDDLAAGFSSSVAGLGQDIGSYIPGPMDFSPGTALSVGGDTGGGFNFGNLMGDISGYAKQALPLLQIGTAGLGAYSGIRGMMEAGNQQKYLTSAEKTAQGAAAPALAAGQQLIPAGTQGVL